MSEDDELMHYGIKRRSGRYPWGSGGNEVQRAKDFFGMVAGLKAQGLSEVQVAKALGFDTTKQLRDTVTIARDTKKQAHIAMATRLKEKGMSNVAIGERMGINESVVRSLLKPAAAEKASILTTIINMLRREVDEREVIQVGAGVENQLGISKEKLGTAVKVLKDEGYGNFNVQVPTGGNNKTSVLVLTKPGIVYQDVASDLSRVRNMSSFSDDGGRSFARTLPPLQVDSKRIAVRYADEGGSDADGVIYVRPGVDDLSLGGARYAQVRIAVDGTHYLKGMAIYRDDLPAGTDLVFNTNKQPTGNKLDAMKKQSDDATNPFGSVYRQLGDRDERGSLTKLRSAMNLVNEEGDWDKWSKNIATQVLSKQPLSIAKRQIDETFARRREDLDEIMKLTNPVVRQKMLENFADSADRNAVTMKAAAMPRQRTQVVLPVDKIKDTEIYAPNFTHGERVALIRYPHGGTFEIPDLVVNNRNVEARKIIGTDAKDAVGINSKVAKQLSGADFDGDTVMVIPQRPGASLTTKRPLKQLEDFDGQRDFKLPEGAPKPTVKAKNQQMGYVSNLITDMTIKGATDDEISRAVRHSMVVIDAEKHGLDMKRSSEEHGIPALVKKYQPRPDGSARPGASTLISRATSETAVPARRLRKASEGEGDNRGPIDKVTGKKVYVPKEDGTYVDRKTGRTVQKYDRIKKIDATDDARTLSSGTAMERIYADHSNRMRALANEARRVAVNTKPITRSPSAAKTYKPEVDQLVADLNIAFKNKPIEKQARIIADAKFKAKYDANPSMDDAEIKKTKRIALEEARDITGAKKTSIPISDKQWAAIQAGAVSPKRLRDILDNTDMEKVRKLATPKADLKMTSAKTLRAQSMLRSGATQAEVAQALGVSLSTLKRTLSEGG